MGRWVGDRKAEEEPIAELWATTTTQRGARPAAAQQAEWPMGYALLAGLASTGLIEGRRALRPAGAAAWLAGRNAHDPRPWDRRSASQHAGDRGGNPRDPLR